MKEIKVYIYALYQNDKVIYIGKSSQPKRRLNEHKNGASQLKFDYAKVLDFYYDREAYWIMKYYFEGAPLKNKRVMPQTEEWNIGDIINLKNI